jgi:tryptophan synthase alpha chain
VNVAPVLEQAKREGRAALIGYLPVGYPDHRTSIAAIEAMVLNGVDIVEIGVPYSDPLMDGPLIQHAVEAALAGGARPRHALEAVAAVAAQGAPALVMTYWNVIDRYGVERMAEDLVAHGGAGLITPDLIPDEGPDWLAASDEHGLDRVFLVAPSSTRERLRRTTEACRGFVYAASTMGVTGVRTSVSDAARTLVARTREVTDVPVCVGLGVSTPEQASEVASFADGVIVGSAFVRALNEGGVEGVGELAKSLAAGVRGTVEAPA